MGGRRDYHESCVFVFLHELEPVLVGLFVKAPALEVVGLGVGSPVLFMHHIINIPVYLFVGGVLRLQLFTRITG